MTEAKRPSEREIDEIVASQADDPSAWEDEIRVHPKRWRVNPTRIELAAKFFVLSALHRLGAKATLALDENEDIDIAVITDAGRALTVEVKTLTGSTRWRVEEIRAQQDHYVLFVCFVEDLHNPHVPPEVYVVPSKDLRNIITDHHLAEIQLSDLAGEMNVREAWYRLTTSTAA